MFGLMRPGQSCPSQPNDDYRFHRMHYCGTCKILGRQYGHRTRLLLNFDVVFLAEILSLVGEEDLSRWNADLQAIDHCMDIPSDSRDLPFSLQYAAATNTLLSALKLEDHLQDAPGIKWHWAQRFYSRAFRESFRQFRTWGADTNVIRKWMAAQFRREKEARTDFHSLPEILTYYAEPSAQLTGWILRHSALVMDRPHLQEALSELGYRFGRLIYVLDAFEDVEKDWANKQFNPLLLYYGASETLTDRQFESARQALISMQESVIQSLQELPLSVPEREKYAARIRSNLALRMYKERPRPFGWMTTVQSGGRALMDALSSLPIALYRFHFYLASQIIWLIPLAADYVSQGEKSKVYQWLGFLIGLLASIGGAKLAIARRKKRKTERKKRKARRKLRRLRRWQRIRQFFTKKRPCEDCGDSDCWESCCAPCLEAILLLCLEILLEMIWALMKKGCQACQDGIEAGKIWPWFVIWLLLMAITLFVVFVLVF